MKIIYHHRTMRTGVEGVHISGVVNGLENLGHKVIEVALVKKEEHIHKKEQKKEKKSILRIIADYFPNIFFRIAEIFYNILCFFKVILAILKNQNVDFIYDRYAYFNFAPTLAGKIMNIPVILEINIVTDLKDTRELELSKLCRSIEQWIMENCQKIFVISDLLKNVLIKRGIEPDKVIVQPNGCDMNIKTVDLSHIIKGPLKQKIERKIVICFLGRLLPWYKLENLIKIFSEIQQTCSDTALMIIGDGPEKNSLLDVVTQYNQQENVLFTGNVTHIEAMSLVGKSDICVIPATNEWTSPVKLFEYMGMGKPVIAPNIKSVSSIMSDGVHGKLFTPGDYNALKAHLLLVIQDQTLRENMGKKARGHIFNNYTWDHVAQQVISAFNKI